MAYSEAQPLPLEQKIAKFNEAADWNHKLIEADPTTRQAYYILGVIAYYKYDPALRAGGIELNMKPTIPGRSRTRRLRRS